MSVGYATLSAVTFAHSSRTDDTQVPALSADELVRLTGGRLLARS